MTDASVARRDKQNSSRNPTVSRLLFQGSEGEGPAAPMGQIDFVQGGAMIGGFALAAAPAEYRVTGVQTFMVSHDGVVYQKDLGPDTLKIFKSMERFNPDKSWRSTSDEW